MLTFPNRHRHELDDLEVERPEHGDPWADGHAAPEDRALGYELELIELQRRRDELAPGHPELARIDAEMGEVLEQLVAVAAHIEVPAPHAA